MNQEHRCDEGYLAAPSLSEINVGLAEGIESWKKLDICPACAGQSLTKFATIKKMPYSRCRDCGFRFANPIPPNDVIGKFYNSIFYSNYRRFEKNRIKLDKYFSISIGIDDMQNIGTWLGSDKKVKILDFGSGPGSFLALLRDKFGFINLEGLELNKESLEVAKSSYGLKLCSSTEELGHSLYDYIILLEVMEHIPEPDIFLSQVSSLLKPGGGLLIATPAVDNPIGLFLPSYADAPYSAPCHVSLFTKKALTCLLARFNFDIEQIKIDESWKVIEKAVTSLFYDLDIISPRHDEDLSDILYIPNALGRLLGFKTQRKLTSLFWRALGRIDGLLARAARWSTVVPMNGHMYMLARKKL